MSDQEEYGKMLTDLIQKQMVVLGPNIALDKARKVAGLKVSFRVVQNWGALQVTGDPKLVLKGVANEYMMLSGQIVQMTLNSLLEKYPQMKM